MPVQGSVCTLLQRCYFREVEAITDKTRCLCRPGLHRGTQNTPVIFQGCSLATIIFET